MRKTPATKVCVGETLWFKHPGSIGLYGESARVVRIEAVFTGSHPGPVFADAVDLVTSNGTALGWDRGMIRTELCRKGAA